MENNVIKIGNSALAPYIVYGDESKFIDTLVYAFCFFRREDIRKIEVELKRIKQHFNFPENTAIHFSALMNESTREKMGLKDFSKETLKAMISSIVDYLNDVPFLLRYSFYTLAGTEIKTHAEDDDEIPFYFEEKGIIGLLCQGNFAVNPNGREGPSAKDCQIFVSEENTKIRFLGNKKERSDRWFSGFSDIGAPKGFVFRIEPNIAKSSDYQLLQVADIFSYICSHAKSEQCRDSFYKEQLLKVKNRVESNLNLKLKL